MNYHYAFDKFMAPAGSDIAKVAEYLETLMFAGGAQQLTESQQDALWTQCRTSEELWNRLVQAEGTGVTVNGVEYYKYPLAFGELAGTQLGLTSVTPSTQRPITLDLADNVKPGGIGSLATTLAHELVHAMDGRLAGTPAQWRADVAAKAGTLSPDGFARYMVATEALAYYYGAVAWTQIITNLPDLDAANRPDKPIFFPDPGIPAGTELANLTEKLIASNSEYRQSADKIYFGLKMGFSPEYVFSDDFGSVFRVERPTDGGYTAVFNTPDGPRRQQFSLNSDGTWAASAVRHISSNAADNIFSESAGFTTTALSVSALSSYQPSNITLAAYSAAGVDLSALDASWQWTFDDWVVNGDLHQYTEWDSSKVYVVGEGLTNLVSFGSGTYQMQFAMNPTASSVHLHESLGNSWVALDNNSDGSIRLSGAQGQYVDFVGAAATTLKFLDGTTLSLSEAMHGYQSAIYGGADHDSLIANTATFVDGGAGNDTVIGSGYADQLLGGAGDDVLDGGNGNDLLDGGDGDDALYSGDGVSVLSGGVGYDLLQSTGNGSTLDGGADDDYLYDQGSANTLSGGAGYDLLRTSGSGATAHGNGDDDTLWNQGTSNVLYGDTGSDYIIDRGTDAIFGWKAGDGMDYVGNAGTNARFRFEGAGIGSIQAHRVGSNLVVSTEAGEGATFENWFDSGSQMDIEAPDGTVWSHEDITEALGNYGTTPSTVAIGQAATSYWTFGTPIVFGSEFRGHDIQATLVGHHVSPYHYDLLLSDGQGTSLLVEGWSQGNVSSVTLPDGTTFTPSQLNAMLHPAAYNVQYNAVYSQNAWSSVMASLGHAYTVNNGAPWVGAFMAGQGTGMYQGSAEPAYEVRRYTVSSPGGGYNFGGGGVTHPTDGSAAVQMQQSGYSSYSVTFDFWGTQGNYSFAIVDATSSYSEVVEQRTQLRDENGALLFNDAAHESPMFGGDWELVSSVYDNSGYHDVPNIVTTRESSLSASLYDSSSVPPVVDTLTLFEAGSPAARGVATYQQGGTFEDDLQARVSTGFLDDSIGQALFADETVSASFANGANASWSPAAVDSWRKGLEWLGEDLTLPERLAAGTKSAPSLVPVGEEYIRVSTGRVAEPSFGFPDGAVVGAGGDSTNAFRLVA